MIHAPELHVADDVVDGEQPDTVVYTVRRFLRDVARQVRAFVAVASDEGVHDVAIRGDGGQLDLSEVVLQDCRLDDPSRAAGDGLAVRLRASGTRSEMSFTPSPCSKAWRPIGVPLRIALVTTRRISSCSST